MRTRQEGLIKMNERYREFMIEKLCGKDQDDLYGTASLAKLLFRNDEGGGAADSGLRFAAEWFLHPHPRGRDRKGEPDFAAAKLIRALYLAEDLLEAETVKAIDDFFTKWNFESKYKSENHLILFHSSRYLYARRRPDIRFFQYGRSAREILREDRVFLKEFLIFRGKRGWAEFDSLGYGAESFGALLNLIDFADGEMRACAELAANVMLSDMIADCSEDGLYGGAHGRVYQQMVFDFKNCPMYGIYQLYFGEGAAEYAGVEAVSSGFRPACWVYEALEARPECWENFECKHLHSITFDTPHKRVPQVPGNINKYTWVTPDYVMGAVNWQDEYPAGSKAAWYAHHQQHEWELTFTGGTDLRVFTHHPGSYGPEGKEHGYWTGDLGCCCGNFFCSKNVVMALYDIPETEMAMIHAHVPFAALETQPDGNYLWMKRSEQVYAVLWFSNGFAPGCEEFLEREVRSFGRKHAVVCMAGTSKEYGSFEQFQETVRSAPPEFDPGRMEIAFRELKMSKSERCLNGKPVKFPYDTCDSPFLSSKYGSGVIISGNTRLDFGQFEKQLYVDWMELIAYRMKKLRPEGTVIYRPFRRVPGVRRHAVAGGLTIDFAAACPEFFGKNASESRCIYVKTMIWGLHPDSCYLNLTGEAEEVSFNGKRLEPERSDEKGICYALELSGRPEELVIRCRCSASGGTIGLVPSAVYYRGMWAADYLNHISLILPVPSRYPEYSDNGDCLEISGEQEEFEKEELVKEVRFEEGEVWEEGILISRPYAQTERPALQEIEYLQPGRGGKRLFSKADSRTDGSVWPEEETIDFMERYGGESGQIAYASARCRKSGTVLIGTHSTFKVFVNGRTVSQNEWQKELQIESQNDWQNEQQDEQQEEQQNGWTNGRRKNEGKNMRQNGRESIWYHEQENKRQSGKTELFLKTGDRILVKIMRNEIDWEFTFADRDKILEPDVPGYHSDRYGSFLLTGSFGRLGAFHIPYGPEAQYPGDENQDLETDKEQYVRKPDAELFGQFSNGFLNADGKACYWQFPEPEVFLRPYLNTSFFGQWFYALMVGNYGILKAAERLNQRDLFDYFMNGLTICKSYFYYMKYDRELFGDASFLQRSTELDNLDAIGAAGLCFAEAYERRPDSGWLAVLYALADAAENRIPRFEDGTFNRKHTMWADDIFMSCPFLARMGRITGEERYFEECIRQIKGFEKRLYMEERGLFSHLYFPESGLANGIPWGRGNGWIFLTLSDLLLILPKQYGAELTGLYRKFAQGIAACQDENGLWHQLLDEPESYPETSCTGMFLTGMAYGIRAGVLSEEYRKNIRKAWEGLKRSAITEEGDVSGVCRGSGCSADREYYRKLGTVENDDHGTGILLMALDAMMEDAGIERCNSERSR